MPLWGAPRIHGELLKLGIDIAQSTVAKYMSRRRGPRSPGWQAFLRNHTAHIAGTDLFVVPTAFPWDEAPRYLIRDRDTSYGAAVTRRLRAMGIRDRPITPRSPWQNGHVERLIGSIRRECLDHVVVFWDWIITVAEVDRRAGHGRLDGQIRLGWEKSRFKAGWPSVIGRAVFPVPRAREQNRRGPQLPTINRCRHPRASDQLPPQ